MFAETLTVVCCCSLLAATAAAAATEFETDAGTVRFPEGTNARRFHTTTAATAQRFHTTAAAATAQRFHTTAGASAGSRPCCGPSSPSPSFAPAAVYPVTTEGGARYYQPQEVNMTSTRFFVSLLPRRRSPRLLLFSSSLVAY